ncbi:MAG TPA: hypothetical protein DEE98_03065 [Elusimicrobia bacterium]|nr:MAG: hypothetical protein A2278_07885 [Elusimicrobia bacterium RIFOXYA12_FULL_49_49]OGS09519.1 MAG: hypothetical protein A2204_06675 [Elusimicrobia bacterium RIFOXYA1_FULL_47_7]OGS11798.1 MAG: hypothetical protein A2386_02155 [Elusimicrobia bacterium RIFOXYB1_FULL_48_9]OGS16015.1 MAG: hypothetical protein A2251_02380 [Elusimicrobia bacterium RIFOXYA2_FULL_47_53]OGS26305.1 MAG: hypothetical protein A2339_02885 [Elusimicrobia bacterium RIFOXYB12_FULL_50_12]OGS29183.1 MAG: hypothetical protein
MSAAEESLMQLSQQERERIYLEEKAKREHSCCSGRHSGHTGSLLVFNLIALIGVAGLVYFAKTLQKKSPSVEDIRKAYDGLSPEDMA